MDDWIRKLNEKAKENESRFREWIRETVDEQDPSSDKRKEAPNAQREAHSDASDENGEEPNEGFPETDAREDDAVPAPENHVMHAIAADALLRRVLERMKKTPEALSTKHDVGASLAEQIHQHLQAAPAFDDLGASDSPEVVSSTSEPQSRESAPQDASLLDTPSGTSEERSAADRQGEQTRTLGALFVSWCQKGGAMLSRYYMFERFLQRETGDDIWHVMPVYCDTQAPTPRLIDDGPDAAEPYWLVEDGDDRWVLPQPQTEDVFCRIAPVFEHDDAVSPASVSAVRPARVKVTGQAYRIRVTGMLQ